jgi:hypothetical protein
MSSTKSQFKMRFFSIDSSKPDHWSRLQPVRQQARERLAVAHQCSHLRDQCKERMIEGVATQNLP